jgi:hypothetical protein
MAGVVWIPLLFALLAAVFAAFALRAWRSHGGAVAPRERTWLLVAAIFALVSAYLFFMTR